MAESDRKIRRSPVVITIIIIVVTALWNAIKKQAFQQQYPDIIFSHYSTSGPCNDSVTWATLKISYWLINWSHTHTRLKALFPGLPGWAGTRKIKPIWIFLKQETVGGSGISWPICKSAPSSRQITTPAPHHSVFLQAGCPSCHPTNSVKALKAKTQ